MTISKYITPLLFIVLLLSPSSFVQAAENATQGSLITVQCPAGADVGHSCRAVYYHANDGKRHAFPNERVFSTWYEDFSSVQIVSSEALAGIPLGSNVTYKPGKVLVKFLTDPKVYAVTLGGELRWVTSASIASSLYGEDWDKNVHDIYDVFYMDYRFGAPIETTQQYNPVVVRSDVPTIDSNLPSTYQLINVETATGTYSTHIITLQRNRYSMRTSVAGTADCLDNCPTMPLLSHAEKHNALIGIHGSYFCPADYAGCAGKVASFLAPMFDSSRDDMVHPGNLPLHKGPLLAETSDGSFHFYRTADLFSNSVAQFEMRENAQLVAAVSNYPTLMDEGRVVTHEESRYETNMDTKATRAGLGWNDDFVYLVVASNASVTDLAHVYLTIGAEGALNLDGGGSTALLFNKKYILGPGRTLPNAVLFVER